MGSVRADIPGVEPAREYIPYAREYSVIESTGLASPEMPGSLHGRLPRGALGSGQRIGPRVMLMSKRVDAAQTAL